MRRLAFVDQHNALATAGFVPCIRQFGYLMADVQRVAVEHAAHQIAASLVRVGDRRDLKQTFECGDESTARNQIRRNAEP